MKPSLIFLMALLLAIPVAAQDYEKDKSSYMYYEGIPSKEFQSFYGKSSSYGKGKSYKSLGKNVIKLGLLEVVQGRPTLFYERVLTKGISVELGMGVNFNPFFGFRNNGNLQNGKSATIDFSNGEYEDVYLMEIYSEHDTKRNLGFHYYFNPRFYMSGNAPQGFYFSPGIAHTFSNFTQSYLDGSYSGEIIMKDEKSTEFGIGAGLGGQYTMSSSVIVDFNIMFYYNSLTQERYSVRQEEMYTLKGKSFQLMYSIKIGGLWGGGKKSKS